MGTCGSGAPTGTRRTITTRAGRRTPGGRGRAPRGSTGAAAGPASPGTAGRRSAAGYPRTPGPTTRGSGWCGSELPSEPRGLPVPGACGNRRQQGFDPHPARGGIVEDVFLSALHESPNDEATWLALADWLEDDG